MTGINVTITSTSPGVSIGGGTSVSVAVSGPSSPVSIAMLAGGSTSLPDITQLEAGPGITITTAANQFLISSYSTSQLGTYSPVKSVNGKTGTVSLQAVDVAAAAAVHTHTTADIVGITSAFGAYAPVQSVAGRTGVITLSSADISGLASIATSGSGADITTGTISAARLPVATTTALGVVQVGSGLSVASGVLSATGSGGPALSNATPAALGTAAAGTSPDASRADHVHELPVATTATLGTIKVGSGLAINSGVLSATGGGGGGGATFVSAPTSAAATGTVGNFAADSSYLYACYSANNWLRVQRASFLTIPSVPLSLSVTAARSGSSTEVSPLDNVSASWEAPVDTGGGLSGYLLQLTPGGTHTVSSATLQYKWSNITAVANFCTLYSVSVKAFNSAGYSEAATDDDISPGTSYAIGLTVSQTPNEGAPGVTYNLFWVVVCLGNYNTYQVQYRLYDVDNGPEDNWTTAGTPTGNSFTHYISDAVSTTHVQWRVRAITVSGGSTTAASEWSSIASTP